MRRLDKTPFGCHPPDQVSRVHQTMGHPYGIPGILIRKRPYGMISSSRRKACVRRLGDPPGPGAPPTPRTLGPAEEDHHRPLFLSYILLLLL